MTFAPSLTFKEMREKCERLQRERMIDEAVLLAIPNESLRALEMCLTLKPTARPLWVKRHVLQIREQFRALKAKRT